VGVGTLGDHGMGGITLGCPRSPRGDGRARTATSGNNRASSPFAAELSRAGPGPGGARRCIDQPARPPRFPAETERTKGQVFAEQPLSKGRPQGDPDSGLPTEPSAGGNGRARQPPGSIGVADDHSSARFGAHPRARRPMHPGNRSPGRVIPRPATTDGGGGRFHGRSGADSGFQGLGLKPRRPAKNASARGVDALVSIGDGQSSGQ